MRLDFNVLVIDDQPNGIKGAIENLKQHVEEEGFRLAVKNATSLDEAVTMIGDHVLADVVDLVLVDYDLGTGSGGGGDEALSHIKTAMPFKEVVFYSARSTAELRKLAYDAGVEGVYCATRISLGETVGGVFDALIKKVLDIDHCRGIILGATSDLDHLVNEMLRTVDAQLTEEQRAASLQFALQRIDATLERFKEKRKTLSKEPNLEALLEENQLFTSADRLHLLLNVHDYRYERKSPLRKAVGRYLAKIPGVRNMFAHVRLTPGDHHTRLSGFGEEKLDPITLRAVRRELIEFRDQFQQLAELFNRAGIEITP